jgi:hypothetical protein
MTGDLHDGENKLPFELLPTSLKGVYSFVPPPKGVDLRKASRSTLMKHGIFMQRPDPLRAPVHFDIWERLVGELWTADNFVTPTFSPGPRVSHRPRPVRQSPEVYGNNQSDNWSGAVVVSEGSPWTGVLGLWQVPKVSQPQTQPDTNDQWTSASWVGLNGGGKLLNGGYLPGTYSNDVLQAGVTQQVGAYAWPPYFAWFEWVIPDAEPLWGVYCGLNAEYCYILPMTITSIPVNPGDTVLVIVQFIIWGGDGWEPPAPGLTSHGGISFVNITTGKMVNLFIYPPPLSSFAGDTAEWVMECPSGPPASDGVAGNGTLPAFTNVPFQLADAFNALSYGSDATIGSDVGLYGNLTDFKDVYGNCETKTTAQRDTVTITYKPPSQ